MPKPPRKKPRFPDEFDREDELQEYQLTAARLRDAAPPTIQRCTKERWDKHWSPKKRREPSQLTKEQVLDRADWDCFRESYGSEDQMIDYLDRKRRIIDPAFDVYPKPIVLAALKLLTVNEAFAACRMRKSEVCRQIKEARQTLEALAEEYEREQEQGDDGERN